MLIITIEKSREGIVSDDQKFIAILFDLETIPLKTLISVKLNGDSVERMEYLKYLTDEEVKQVTDYINDKWVIST